MNENDKLNILWTTDNKDTIFNTYEIPPEALQDEEFARMIREAEKYLGVPYVWGGYSPSGFDCSGFVSYVINHCGNGWNYGRLTADGLRGVCTYVSPQEAKPGDLIFFQGTYNTSGASHVGIYVGNNMICLLYTSTSVRQMEKPQGGYGGLERPEVLRNLAA